MFVIRDKTTQVVLHIAQSAPGERRKPEEVYPEWDAATMEFGRTDAPGIPASFTIVRGVVRAAEEVPPAPEAAEEAAPLPLGDAKARLREHYSALSLQLRRELIPAYKLENAALGVYDEERVRAIRGTMQAFRDEYHRLEAAIDAASSMEELGRVKARFPKAVAAGKEARAQEPEAAPRTRGKTR